MVSISIMAHPAARFAFRALVTVALLWAAMGVFLFVVQRRMMFHPPPEVITPSDPGAVLLRLPTHEGWDVAALHWPAPDGARTVVHFHGNGEQLAWQVELGRAYHAAGYGFVAMEYPGYGVMNTSSPSETSLYLAAETLLQHCEATLHIPRERLVLQGFSLGTGVASEMARRGHGARLVLIAPYTSMLAMAARQAPLWPTGFLLRDRFDTLGRAPQITQPTLLLHGEVDEVIPPVMSETLRGAFPHAERVLLRGVGHNNLYALAEEQLLAAVTRFAPPR